MTEPRSALRLPRIGTVLGASAVLVAAPPAVAALDTLLTAEPAGAANATLTVTNLDASGPGSLADAIATAETTPGADAIVFDVSLDGTIVTTSSFEIGQDLVIDGGGRITLDGNDDHRLFELTPNSQTLTLRNLTLTRGSATQGGAVHATSDANLVADHVTFSDNTATGGLRCGGAIAMFQRTNLTLVDSVLSGNSCSAVPSTGGAVHFGSDEGTVTVSRTTVTGNSAWSAGGLELWASTATITDSVVSDNSSSDPGELGGAFLSAIELHVDGLVAERNTGLGIFVNGSGSGHADLDRVRISDSPSGLTIAQQNRPTALRRSTITGASVAAVTTYVCDSDLEIDSSTFADNPGRAIEHHANGFLYCTSHSLDVRHTTVTRNGTGLWMDPTTTGSISLDHTVVADNTVDLDAVDDAGTPGTTAISAMWSLVGKPNGALTSATDTITGVDPDLAPLTWIDPYIGVCAFTDDSAVFNAGNPAFTPPPATDQTGQPRVAFGRIDIGAWELQPAPEPVVPAFTG